MRALSSILAHHTELALFGLVVLMAHAATDWRLALVLTSATVVGFVLGAYAVRQGGESAAFLAGAPIPLALGTLLLGGAITTTAWAFGPPVGLLVGFVYGRFSARAHRDGTCQNCPRRDRHVSRPDGGRPPLRRVA